MDVDHEHFREDCGKKTVVITSVENRYSYIFSEWGEDYIGDLETACFQT